MHAQPRVGVARRAVAASVLAVATFYVFGLVTLAAWAFVPSALGWTPMAISSGSMTPGIAVGDVVVVDRYNGRDLAAGTVVTFREADRQVTHRILEVTDDGYVTKGDANRTPDSTLVHADAIVGTGRVLVPALARPLLWLQAGDHAPVAAWGLLTLAALAVVAARPGVSASTAPQTPPTDRQPDPVATGGAPPSRVWTAHWRTAPRSLVERPAARSAYLPPGAVWHAGQLPGTRPEAGTRRHWLRRATVVASAMAVLAGGLFGGWVDVTAAALADITTSTGDWAADLAAPTDLQGTAGCHNNDTEAHVDLSWTPNTDADGYDVFRTTDPDAGWTNIARVEGGATDQYRDDTVQENTYHYRLEATAASFRSAPSESVEVVVAASALPCV